MAEELEVELEDELAEVVAQGTLGSTCRGRIGAWSNPYLVSHLLECPT